MSRRSRAFTLIEVLVALVVLGAVASAAIALIGQNTRFIASAEDRVIAQIVADNAMVDALSLVRIDIGVAAYDTEFAGERWRATRTVADPGVAGLLRIDIAVQREGSAQTLARISTLKPQDDGTDAVAGGAGR